MKKYIGLEEMNNANCSSVLSMIRERGEVSRKQIALETGLSWGGMTKIVNRLFEHGYIVEDKSEQTSGSGRIPHIIRINKEQHFVIGLDINRTGFSAYVMNLAQEVCRKYVREAVFQNREELLNEIIDFTGRIVEEFRNRKVLAIGVAMQGILDVENGVSVRFPHCKDWQNVPIREILEKKFQVSVFVEHDPNCVLYSCMKKAENENMLLFRIDSSIGMAVSINGKILRGNGLLEVAHYTAVVGGKRCRCGQNGCMEAYLSSCFENGVLIEESLSGMVLPLSVFLSNMSKIFNAEKIILTGRLIKYRHLFEKQLISSFAGICDSDATIRMFEEEEHAVYGAALIAMNGAVDRFRI